MKYRLLLPALLVVALAGAKDQFLPMEQAFRYLVEADGDCLTVQWNVAPGYYLYKSRMSLSSTTPGVAIGEPRYPKGEIHEDEYFGAQEIFRDDLKVTAPITLGPAAPRKFAVQVKLQGCADAGLCYPPTTWIAEVERLPGSR